MEYTGKRRATWSEERRALEREADRIRRSKYYYVVRDEQSNIVSKNNRADRAAEKANRIPGYTWERVDIDGSDT
jgi:hypothetical protein